MGFVDYPWEFWHYSSGDAYEPVQRHTGRPAVYGAVHWDAATNSVTPLPQPEEPLNSFDEIRAAIDAALARPGLRRLADYWPLKHQPASPTASGALPKFDVLCACLISVAAKPAPRADREASVGRSAVPTALRCSRSWPGA